jgi:hypothetical protein
MSPPWSQLHGAQDDVMAVFRSLKKQHHAPHLPWRKLLDTTSLSSVVVDTILVTFGISTPGNLVRDSESAMKLRTLCATHETWARDTVFLF